MTSAYIVVVDDRDSLATLGTIDGMSMLCLTTTLHLKLPLQTGPRLFNRGTF